MSDHRRWLPGITVAHNHIATTAVLATSCPPSVVCYQAKKRLTMNHHRRVFQRKTIPLLPARQQQTTHTRRHAQTKRVHRRGDVLHRVVDCQTGRDRSARRVDIQFDGFAGIFRLEKEQLRREERRGLVVDLGLVLRSAVGEALRRDETVAPLVFLEQRRDDTRWTGRRSRKPLTGPRKITLSLSSLE